MVQGSIGKEEKRDKQADLKRRIDNARAEAIKQPFDVRPGPEWPDPDELSLEEACTDLSVQMYTLGGKISLGVTSEATSVWARVSFPTWCPEAGLRGMSAMTFSGDVERAIRKLAQLAEDWKHAGFKPDPYAK